MHGKKFGLWRYSKYFEFQNFNVFHWFDDNLEFMYFKIGCVVNSKVIENPRLEFFPWKLFDLIKLNQFL